MVILWVGQYYCMGGPGVLVNSYAIKAFSKVVKTCMGRLETTHEDVEIGRCFTRQGIANCTKSWEIHDKLYHNLKNEVSDTLLCTDFQTSTSSKAISRQTSKTMFSKQQAMGFAFWKYFNWWNFFWGIYWKKLIQIPKNIIIQPAAILDLVKVNKTIH